MTFPANSFVYLKTNIGNKGPVRSKMLLVNVPVGRF